MPKIHRKRKTDTFLLTPTHILQHGDEDGSAGFGTTVKHEYKKVLTSSIALNGLLQKRLIALVFAPQFRVVTLMSH